MDEIVVSAGKERPLPPAGTHQAICVDVTRLGNLWSSLQKAYTPKISIVWAYYDDEGNMHTISKWYTPSLKERSALRADLTAWRGKPFTPEELNGFRLNNIIGANCMLSVIHEDTENGKKAKVKTVTSLPAKMPKIEMPEDYIPLAERPDAMPSEVFAARWNIRAGMPRPGDVELVAEWEAKREAAKEAARNNSNETVTADGTKVPF